MTGVLVCTTVGVPVVGVSDTPKALLACCVPDLQLHLRPVHSHHLVLRTGERGTELGQAGLGEQGERKNWPGERGKDGRVRGKNGKVREKNVQVRGKDNQVRGSILAK